MKIQFRCGILFMAVLLLWGCSESVPPENSGRTWDAAVYGDSQGFDKTHKKVVEAIMAHKPSTVFHVGDLVAHGERPEEWEQFNLITREMRASAAFYPILGNHDNDSDFYFENFGLTRDQRHYTVQVGPLYAVLLDSNQDFKPGSDEYVWLETQLSRVPEGTEYTAVFMHHPIFTSGHGTPDYPRFWFTLAPLFVEKGVDIVFSGHTHSYERSRFEDMIAVTTGGGGGGLVDPVRHNPYEEKFIKTHNYCLLSFGAEGMTIEVLDLKGKSIDRIHIARDREQHRKAR